MNSILDKMCLKRLCLPSNTDIELLRSGNIKCSMCDWGNSHHIACTFEGKSYCLKGHNIWDKYV